MQNMSFIVAHLSAHHRLRQASAGTFPPFEHLTHCLENGTMPDSFFQAMLKAKAARTKKRGDSRAIRS